jgi:hypothetical protein
MRMAGTSRQLVSSQSFRGEMARKRAASAGRRSSGSGRGSRGRPSGWIGLVFSIGVPQGAAAPSGQSKHGGAVTDDGVRTHEESVRAQFLSRVREIRPPMRRLRRAGCWTMVADSAGIAPEARHRVHGTPQCRTWLSR